MITRMQYYVANRELEWVDSLSFSALGICVLVWPQVVTAPAFRFFAYVVPHSLIGVLLLACGMTCIVSLLVNGRSAVLGPRIRAWTALIRASLLLQFWLSTVQSSVEQGFPYTVTPFWLGFALGELWVAYRAVLDVRTPK